MFNFKDKTYVVLEFVAINGYFSGIETKKDKLEVRLSYPTVIEVAAVRIENGEIIGHYSTFVGIDGYDAHDLKFDEDSSEFYGITAEHLINAPSFFDMAKNLFEYIEGCTVITRYLAHDSRNPLHIIKNYMEPVGYVFNNPVISINNIITAIKMKDSLSNCTNEQTGLDCYKLALSLEDKECYYDLVAQYLDCDAESGRQDSLSRALIMARLFIELSKDKIPLEPIDEPAPF